MDYYKILGTHKHASPEEIDLAFKQKMQEYNPEKLILQGEEKYADSMKSVMHINEAYQVLRDPQKRKQIDDNPKIALRKIKETEKKTQKLFDTTIRHKIEKLKFQRIKSIRERAEDNFSENKTLLREALEGKVAPIERMRDKIERRKHGPLINKEEIEAKYIEREDEEFVCPLKGHVVDEEITEIDIQDEEYFTGNQALTQEDEYSIHDNEAIEELIAPLDNTALTPAEIISPKQEMELGKHDKEMQSQQDFFNTQALFYKGLMYMESHKYKQAMDIFTHLMPFSETYPYLYVIHACQCAFHLGYYNYILDKTLEAMRAYMSPKYLTFLIDKPDNHIFKLLLELFFQNFALCSTKRKIRLKKLIQAENEVFQIVKNMSARNSSLSGYAGFKSAVAYADLSEIYKEKTFILKSLEKLNYVPKELYEKKSVKRISRIMKKFFTRKELKSFKMIYPVLRESNS